MDSIGKTAKKSARFLAAQKIRKAIKLRIKTLTKKQIAIINNTSLCELEVALDALFAVATCIDIKNDIWVDITPSGVTQYFSISFRRLLKSLTQLSISIDYQQRTIIEYLVSSSLCDSEIEGVTESAPLSAKKFWTLLYSLNIKVSMADELYNGYRTKENVTYLLHINMGQYVYGVTFCRKANVIKYNSYRCAYGETTVKGVTYLYFKKNT